MDTPVKSLTNLFVIFIGVFLLMSCVTFAILSNNARDTLNAVVAYVEIKGYDEGTISNVAERTGTEIAVVPLNSNEGITANGDKNRYQVDVSFEHIFAWILQRNKVTYTAITRAVEF